jgi:hypothetical protein
MRLTNLLKEPRLALPPPPASWEVRLLGQTLQEAIVTPNVTLRVRALVVPTLEYTEWLEGIMLEDAPVGTTLKSFMTRPITTANGLPAVLAHHALLDSAGAELEERVGVFYAVVHNRAEVIVRLRGTTWTEHEAELSPYILAGSIEWPEYEDDLVITQLGLSA